MRRFAKWLLPASVTALLLAFGCRGPPEEAQEAEPETTAEPEPAEKEPRVGEPKKEESTPEGTAQAAPIEAAVVPVTSV